MFDHFSMNCISILTPAKERPCKSKQGHGQDAWPFQKLTFTNSVDQPFFLFEMWKLPSTSNIRNLDVWGYIYIHTVYIYIPYIYMYISTYIWHINIKVYVCIVLYTHTVQYIIALSYLTSWFHLVDVLHLQGHVRYYSLVDKRLHGWNMDLLIDKDALGFQPPSKE